MASGDRAGTVGRRRSQEARAAYRTRLQLEPLEDRRLLKAGVQLVADINPGAAGSNLVSFASVNGWWYVSNFGVPWTNQFPEWHFGFTTDTPYFTATP